MCGRYVLNSADDDLVALFGVDLVIGEARPSYNVAPSTQVRAVIERVSEAAANETLNDSSSSGADAHGTARINRQLRSMRWGFTPQWATKRSAFLINVRSETLTKKPTFKESASCRRCLIPANGYYEWKKTGGASRAKRPFYMSIDEGGTTFAFAGIYDASRNPDARAGEDPWVRTCAIVTQPPIAALEHIHNRMPLLVDPAYWDAWLDPGCTEPDSVDALIAALPEVDLQAHPVSAEVGSPSVDHPGLIEPID